MPPLCGSRSPTTITASPCLLCLPGADCAPARALSQGCLCQEPAVNMPCRGVICTRGWASFGGGANSGQHTGFGQMLGSSMRACRPFTRKAHDLGTLEVNSQRLLEVPVLRRQETRDCPPPSTRPARRRQPQVEGRSPRNVSRQFFHHLSGSSRKMRREVAPSRCQIWRPLRAGLARARTE